ncbi:MAG: hypothetical protein WBA76_12230 [Phormidesmis sp.]
MTKLSTLLATGGLTAWASLLAAPMAFAQSAPTEAVTEFMADYVPTDCTVQFGYVATGSLPQQLAQDFEQTMDKVMINQPLTSCDATTGTDDGDTRNFNFIHADDGVYKVITESASAYDEASGTYRFEVLGVRFIPIDAEGELEASKAVTMRAIADGVCEVDDPADPYSVFCEFATIGDDGSELAVGQLSYLY